MMNISQPKTSDSVFDFILKFKSEHDGNSPSLRQIGEACFISSSSTVSYHLNRLECLGKIKLEAVEGKRRTIEVVGGTWNPPIQTAVVNA